MDGQTDGRTHDDIIYRGSIASRGKNARDKAQVTQQQRLFKQLRLLKFIVVFKLRSTVTTLLLKKWLQTFNREYIV